MNIAKNNVASKLFVAFVAAAMLFTLAAPSAKAATTEELQAQITALMAQIAALTTSVDSGAGAAACTFTRALTLGSEGADVNCLQNYLTSTGHFKFSGGSTGYFGAVTASAVGAWQGANGVSPAVGYFGPVSQAKYAALVAATPSVPTTPTTPTTPGTDDSDDDSSVSLSGEASLDRYEADDADDDTIEEAAEEAEVAVFTAEFADGDAEISRIDVAFTNVTVGARAWDAFDTISLWVDGEMIAEEDASSRDDYLGDEDNGIIRFSGLSLVAMEDEELEITVAATIQDNLDAEELSTWTVTTESLRFFDADGVATTDITLVDDESAEFTIEVAGSDDEALVKTSSNNPVATTLQVKDNSKSDDYTVFAFDIDTDDSTNDLDVNEVTLTVTVTGATTTYALVVDDAELVIDGVTIDDVTVTNQNTQTATLKFNVDGDVTIDAGDRVEAELVLTFKSLAIFNEGITVTSAVASGAIEVEGADTFTSTGAASGKVHTLRTSGAILEVGAMTGTGKDNTDLTTDDSGTFILKFDVTAFDQDLYVNKTAVSGTVAGTEGVNFVVTNGSGVTSVTAGTPTASLSATAATEGTQFKVAEGETETFTLTVSVDPTATNFYGVQLYSFNFDGTLGANPSAYQRALPAENFETDPLEIKN